MTLRRFHEGTLDQTPWNSRISDLRAAASSRILPPFPSRQNQFLVLKLCNRRELSTKWPSGLYSSMDDLLLKVLVGSHNSRMQRKFRREFRERVPLVCQDKSGLQEKKKVTHALFCVRTDTARRRGQHRLLLPSFPTTSQSKRRRAPTRSSITNSEDTIFSSDAI